MVELNMTSKEEVKLSILCLQVSFLKIITTDMLMCIHYLYGHRCIYEYVHVELFSKMKTSLFFACSSDGLFFYT